MHAVGSEGAVRGVQDQRPVWPRARRGSGIERTTLGDWLSLPSGERGLKGDCLASGLGNWVLGVGDGTSYAEEKPREACGAGRWQLETRSGVGDGALLLRRALSARPAALLRHTPSPPPSP